MARGGTKFPLIVYRHLLSRWWPPMIAMGLGMFGIGLRTVYGTDGSVPAHGVGMPLIVVGVLAILIGVFFLVIRQVAYVQAFPGYLKFVTPFYAIEYFL